MSSIAANFAFRVFCLLLVVFGAGEISQMNAQGNVDPTFNAVPTGSVSAAAVTGDGKVLLAGPFTHMNGTPRAGIARVNADGSTDMSFDPGMGFGTGPEDLVIQPDGKILAAGPFTSYNGAAVTGLVRINATGTRDSTFNPIVSSHPFAVALQSDGKILIAGNFSSVNAAASTGVARLNADGTLDAAYNPTIGNPLNGSPRQVRSILQRPDGKVLIGGNFWGVNGWNMQNLARLNADGSTDNTLFAPDTPSVENVYPLPNGEFLLLHPTNLSIRHASGASTFFWPPAFSSTTSDTQLHSLFVQPDYSIIVVGRFDSVGPYHTRPNIARIAPNATLDVLYMQNGANGRVRTIVPYGADKFIVGGDFTSIDTVSRPGVARLNVTPYRVKTPYDFNGDGFADFTVYRPGSGVWYELFSGGTAFEAPVFGIAGDVPVPADYDGDGKADEAIYRPSSGDWWWQSSINGAQISRRYGAPGDIPIPGDWDGDGRADAILYRPSTSVWYRLGSLGGEAFPELFGQAGDVPVFGDFNGDGKTDLAVFRPSNGYWVYRNAAGGGGATHWGKNGDIPVPADYNGDGGTEFAIYRPSDGVWWVLLDNRNGGTYTTTKWGVPGDKPVPADYDGDGRADIAVYRPSNGIWYVIRSSTGFGGVQWGISTDIPAPAFMQFP